MAEGDYVLVITHNGGTITYNSATSPGLLKAMSRPLDMTENGVWNLTVTLDNDITVASQNILSSSCALWSSGTGAIDIGDMVDLSLYTTISPSSAVAVFHGGIAKITPKEDGRTVELVFSDPLAKYEGIGKSVYKTIYSNYRDSIWCQHNISTNSMTLTLPDSNAILPMVKATIMAGDSRYAAIGGGELAVEYPMGNGYDIAQYFIAPGDALVGLVFGYTTGSGVSGTLTVSICRDNGSGLPNTASPLKSVSVSLAAAQTYKQVNVDLTSSSEPLKVVNGAKYWVYFHTTISSIYVYLNTAVSTDSAISGCYYKSDGTNWTSEPHMVWLYIDYLTEQDITGMSVSGTTLTITEVANSSSLSISPTQSYNTTFKRGFVSYYYGTVTLATVFSALIGLGSCTASVNANAVKTLGLYRTKGNYLSDCLANLAEVREDSGSWSGSQHVVHGARVGSTDYIYVSRRLNTTDDSSYKTFSYAPDTSTDDEARIISFTPTKTIKGRACVVHVTGTDSDGNAINVTVSDESLSSGGFSAKSGIVLEVSITDDSLKTIVDCARAGYAQLDAIARDQWEGTLKLSGIYPELFDLTSSSATFGSGRIITLNYSPYGITAQKFKVKSVRIGSDDGDNFVTEVEISNFSALVKNPYSDTSAQVQQTESFISPTDGQGTFYIKVLCPYVPASNPSPAYIRLLDASGGPLNGVNEAVQATVITNTIYNQRIYHAEFAAGNSWTTDGTPVAKIQLRSSGTYVLINGLSSYTLGTSYQFPKWKDMKVVIDLVTKIA